MLPLIAETLPFVKSNLKRISLISIFGQANWSKFSKQLLKKTFAAQAEIIKPIKQAYEKNEIKRNQNHLLF